jgi:hypothetical protein
LLRSQAETLLVELALNELLLQVTYGFAKRGNTLSNKGITDALPFEILKSQSLQIQFSLQLSELQSQLRILQTGELLSGDNMFTRMNTVHQSPRHRDVDTLGFALIDEHVRCHSTRQRVAQQEYQASQRESRTQPKSWPVDLLAIRGRFQK